MIFAQVLLHIYIIIIFNYFIISFSSTKEIFYEKKKLNRLLIIKRLIS